MVCISGGLVACSPCFCITIAQSIRSFAQTFSSSSSSSNFPAFDYEDEDDDEDDLVAAPAALCLCDFPVFRLAADRWLSLFKNHPIHPEITGGLDCHGSNFMQLLPALVVKPEPDGL